MLAALFTASPALANPYAGWTYTCSPICTGVRMTYVEPVPLYVGKLAETADASLIWVGIESGAGHTAACNDGPLVQHGTAPIIYKDNAFPETHNTWHQEYPCDGLSGTTATINAEAGDTIFLQLLCTANCTQGSTTASITYTWTNLTKNLTVNLVRPLNGTGNPVVTATMYWDQADFIIEGKVPYPIGMAPLKIIHPQVFQGGVWVPVPFVNRTGSRPHNTALLTGTAPHYWNVYSPSPLINDGGTGETVFYICSDIVIDERGFTGGQPCPDLNRFGA